MRDSRLGIRPLKAAAETAAGLALGLAVAAGLGVGSLPLLLKSLVL